MSKKKGQTLGVFTALGEILPKARIVALFKAHNNFTQAELYFRIACVWAGAKAESAG